MDQDGRWEEIVAAEDSPAYLIELLRAFVIHFPDVAGGWAKLGKTCARISRFREAEDALRHALDIASPEYRCHVLAHLGQMFKYRGDFAQAEYWYRQAIKDFPQDASAYIFLGGMLARLGRLAEAEQLHRRAIACEDGCIDEAYLNLGLVLRAQERYEEALECFELALGIDADYEGVREASQDVVRALQARRKSSDLR